MTPDLAHSTQARLVNHAKKLGADPELVLTRYAIERYLYRLSRSVHAERFVLKGALLLLAWLGETIRPTRDLDLLGFGEFGQADLVKLFTEVCTIQVEPDAMIFDPASIRIDPIRPEERYGGQRVTLVAHLGKARLRVQIDIGIGDSVVPEPEWLEYPSMLDLPRPRIRAYRPETVIAEKVHAMVVLGSKNSRMRDFFDVDILAAKESFDGRQLVEAVVATFSQRRTTLPSELPFALTSPFADVEGKQAQWDGFVRRIPTNSGARTLRDAMNRIAVFVTPVLLAAERGETFLGRWSPGGPWVLQKSV